MFSGLEGKGKLDQCGGKATRRITALMVLLLGTAGLRSGVIGARWGQLKRDPDAYRLIAENLRRHAAYSRSQHDTPLRPTAFRPPLYPVLLAIFDRDDQVTAGTVALLHGLLGILSVLLTWRLAERWNLGRGSYVVAVMVACDPILLNQSTEVMTETLATFLAIATLLALTPVCRCQRAEPQSAGNHEASLCDRAPLGCLSPFARAGRRRAVQPPLSWPASLLAGLVLGLASLCRPTFLLWMALTILWILVSHRHWKGVQSAACLAGGCFLVLTPWIIRNQQTMGHPIVTTTHGGYTLLLGNNPFFYRHLSEGGWTEVWDARELWPMLESTAPSASDGSTASERSGPTGSASGEHPEIVADRRLYRLAWETIRADPAMFVAASLVRIYRFWTPLPHRLSREASARRAFARGCVAVWYTVVYLVALVGLRQLGRRAVGPPWVWGVLCVCVLSAVHTVYWSNMRMRAPAMPMVYLVFAFGLREIQERTARRKWFNSSVLRRSRGRETWVARE